MLWWVFCAIMVASPLLLFLILDLARSHYARGPKVAKNPPAARLSSCAPPVLRELTVGLEAQFLVAPLRAIREAEMSLLLSGRACPPHQIDEDQSPAALRSTFEKLLMRLEETEKASNHAARKP